MLTEERNYSPELLAAAREAIRVGCAILRGDVVETANDAPSAGSLAPVGLPLAPVLEFGPYRRFKITGADHPVALRALNTEAEIGRLVGR